MSAPTHPRDPEQQLLAKALREQEQQVPVVDVRAALQTRLQAETEERAVGYVVAQALLLAALLAGVAWYFWP